MTAINVLMVHIFLCEPFLFIIHYFAGTTAPLYFSLMKSRMSLDCNTSTKALIFSSSL